MNIQEVIVVEGKDDTVAVKRAIGADTIETNGSAVSFRTLEQIAHAFEKRGVIVFTDPDYPGRRIRAIIEEHVPGVKHAFLEKNRTLAPNGKGLGIEHATDEDIREALAAVYTRRDAGAMWQPTLTDLLEHRLTAHPAARLRRERLGDLLKIGYTNAKGLQKRLRMFGITAQQFEEAVRTLDQEEEHD
ncbi:ribonuclease M5 [Planococcus lenghuensis]|uniref:Ribonuclease M5 n=1 Tax=Planococcus lenghuensis TaxID=2213202 RepID=A0A1Q2L3E7_9BACL|nr:ribonuclease M5 [Planococcus lenghuensis]AQQ54936.1 ribonuclease M5 [Planococcus lenghuensis]